MLRALARPRFGDIFISGGLEALKEPTPEVEMSADVTEPAADRIPGVDGAALVRLNGAIQLGAGTLLALGLLPRGAALALASSLVPTTLAAHRFWEVDDESDKAQQQIQFTKNVGLLGGLLLVVADG